MAFSIGDDRLLLDGRPVEFIKSIFGGGGFGAGHPRILVMHFTFGASGRSSASWFRDPANPGSSAHLVVDRESLTRRPVTAGAVFIGPYTTQAAGDYATGSNHVLPTAGAARFRGGLSAADFMRVMAVQRVTKAGLARLRPIIVPLARAEGLTAHAESIEVRLR